MGMLKTVREHEPMDYRHTLPEGTLLDGHYRIDRVIGVGGFGVTYAAVDTQLDLPVAIKEYFPAEFGTRDSALVVRAAADNHKEIFDHCRNSFMREGRTLAQFRHPAIVRVLWVFEANAGARRFEDKITVL